MECRLTQSSGPWSCKVSIRWEYDASGDNRNEEVSEVEFGPPISDPDDVELRLRQAQAAVLNPLMSAKSFLNMTEDDMDGDNASNTKPLSFSRNVVCVDLEGEDLTDLSFIDLPGIFYTLTHRLLDSSVDRTHSECRRRYR
jgi:hypothetical protein